MRTPLLYALHSGNLYGTERMALSTALGLSDEFDPVIFAPPGRALEEAARMGFAVRAFASPREFARVLRPFLAGNREVAFIATGVVHSLVFQALNLFYHRRSSHLHVVHGGTDEHLSYGRKRRLKLMKVRFVAVSGYVKERLTAHGVPPERITVIENFLAPDGERAAPRRGAFTEPGVRRATVISRIDPIKRVDLLLDALDLAPELALLGIRVLGTGWELDKLRERAAVRHANVAFVGFTDGVAEELAASDLLIHLCPVEPFGLAVIEAMRAGVPVLAPDAGGAGSLVEDGVSGFHFRADDARDLAAKLKELMRAPAGSLNGVVAGGDRALATRFSPEERLKDYRKLIEESENER
jgi:glycosyltransferase involved in cell wall biosynthesis